MSSASQQRAAAAAATRRWRERRANGSLIVPVELFQYEIEALARRGLLTRAQMGDRSEVGYAVALLVEQILERSNTTHRGW
jgi:hypothetical protein